LGGHNYSLMPQHKLPLNPNMHERHPGLTAALAAAYFEAASVCLDRHHSPPKTFAVSNGHTSTNAVATWTVTDARTRRAWANESDATRDGAYGCALAAVDLAFKMVAVRRAETLTGADYYIAPPNASTEDLEDALRLEVSGVDRGNKATLARRLRKKSAQAAAGRSNLPAMACIVGFQAMIILLESE
ncbi:MAG: hypothetical protein ACREAC_03420, partial [Blastocatellia bacterium]